MDLGRLHVLVVDDGGDAADSTAELLTLWGYDWGYDAAARYDGAAALASARARHPDAVILDLAMPRMNGFRFAGLLRSLPGCAAVPIIAVSGLSGAAYLTRAREAGIRHYLLKPADPDRLRALLACEVVPAAVPRSADRAAPAVPLHAPCTAPA
jgi:CheY-like chemotaxis protein